MENEINKCANCEFLHDGATDYTGNECRKNAPGINKKGIACFPTIRRDYTCGQFEVSKRLEQEFDTRYWKDHKYYLSFLDHGLSLLEKDIAFKKYLRKRI